MSLEDENRKALVSLYKEKAQETWSEVQVSIEKEKWSMAANRLYYALFHAVTALLVKHGLPVGTHQGAKVKFGQFFVKTGYVTPDQGRLYAQLESLRARADYDCYFKATKASIDEYYDVAAELYDRILTLIDTDN